MEIRFLSSNKFKIHEIKEILKEIDVHVIPIASKIDELQTDDVKRLVRDKVLKAFKEIGKPLFVEHTGLYINDLNEFPGGLTQVFWDRLKADKFTEIISNLKDKTLTAKTIIGYCDSRKVYYFEGSISGRVPRKPKGNRAFQWDCVFIPDGYCKTFAEMGKLKNKISMRRKAIDSFYEYLKGGPCGTII